MSDSEYTNKATGYIEGFVFRPPEVEAKHAAAYDSVKELNRSDYIDSVEHLYGRNVFHLTEKASNLSPLQKLVLADGGACPFGGVVNGLKVEVYND